MQKQVRKLKILALFAICIFFVACEKLPSDLKQPLSNESGFSFYDNPLSYINNIRAKSNLNPLKPNQILDLAALNHAQYVVSNEIISHDELSSYSNFTGETPTQRAINAGYHSGVRENLSYDAIDLKSAIDGLMSAIYHRFTFLSFKNDEIGIGYFDNSKHSSYVFELGNSKIENFCNTGKSDVGNGKFMLGLCKDSGIRIKSQNYDNSNALNFAKYAYYPSSEPALAFFSNEIPNPYPECKITANPVSIEFNPNLKNIKMQNFTILKDGNTVEMGKILTAKNDTNKAFTQNQFAAFALKPFEFGATYSVKFEYLQDDKPKILTWDFKTQTPKFDYFVVKNGDKLALKNDKFYNIFISPDDCNDVLEHYNISYAFMQKPEISMDGANLFRVKLIGAKGSKLSIETSNGKKIDLYLSDSTDKYSIISNFYGIIVVLIALLVLFYLIRRTKR